MTSTTAADAAAAPGARWGARTGRGLRRLGRSLGVVAFWLAVWQLVALAVGQELLLAAPGRVVVRFGELVVTGEFWGTVWFSLARISAGFLLAAVVGVLLAALASASRLVDALLSPLVMAIRAAPVVSFIILVLLWVDSSTLALVISFLMVLPIVYANVREGIGQRDRALLEVAQVFQVPFRRRLGAIDVPEVLPFFIAACKVGVGLAWKSGIAAEVIGLAQGSIGERLYEAKLFLSSADLFAWTAVIITISAIFERALLVATRRAERRLAAGASVGRSS